MKRSRPVGLLLLTMCSGELPGEPIATYRVVMHLTENTCGAQAVLTRDGHAFSVELREDRPRGHGYWHLADKASVRGTIDGAHSFTFTSSSVAASEGPDAGARGCRLVQADVISVHLRGPALDGGVVAEGEGDGGDLPLSHLVGEQVSRITSGAGTDCSRALIAGGGSFEALPCTIRYALRGNERSPF